MGTINFGARQSGLSTYSQVEIALPGHPTTPFKYDDVWALRSIYSFTPANFPGKKSYRTNSGVVMRLADDPKGGQTIPTFNEGLLLVESSLGFSEKAVDEIVLAAVAMLAKNEKTKADNKAGLEIFGQILGAGA